ncbi:hypothetical protein ACIBI9_53585 [Nonomuraea sp. NPDC050451]|uniref:hypothetical protein n=1 Tax=Nonomuraea sp. NPDC050451 TaxID=3364364 RepID=UPI00379E6654
MHACQTPEAFSDRVRSRTAGSTQTWSLDRAPRQTYPLAQVSGANAVSAPAPVTPSTDIARHPDAAIAASLPERVGMFFLRERSRNGSRAGTPSPVIASCPAAHRRA